MAKMKIRPLGDKVVVKRLEADVKRKRLEAEAQIARLRGELERDESELERKIGNARNGLRAQSNEREIMAKSRRADGQTAKTRALRAPRSKRRR